jgi:hypothetical protein
MAGSSLERLCIGDIHVALTSNDPGLRVEVSGPMRRFRVDAGRANDATVTTALGDLRANAIGRPIFDSGGLWKLYGDGGDYVFRLSSPAFGAHPYKEARFSSDFTRGDVTLHADFHEKGHPIFPLEYPLDELLLTNLLARGRGVELHACGLIDRDGRGYLFAGHSGAGKTTTAKLWDSAGVSVLSDDRIILRCLDGKVWMYGTPWHGEAQFAAPTRTELMHVFALHHGAANRCRRLPQPEAVSSLFARGFVPFYHAAALAYTLEVLQQITDAVPCSELRFVPDKEVIDFVRASATRPAAAPCA